MKTYILIILILINLNVFAGGSGSGGGPRPETMMKIDLGGKLGGGDIFTDLAKFDKDIVKDIQFTDGEILDVLSATKKSLDLKIRDKSLLIKTNSTEIHDVQLINGKTCVILDKTCY